MEKLKDLLRTKYIHAHYENALRNILQEQTELDLCDCKFERNAKSILCEYYGRVKMYNTSNAILNDILEHNCTAAFERPAHTQTLPMEFETTEDALYFFKNGLKKDVIYDLKNCNKNKLRGLSVAILVTLRDPEIYLDAREFTSDLFKQVRIDWLKRKGSHAEYIEAVGVATLTRRVDAEGNVYMPGFGKMKEEVYVSNYNALPMIFGSDNLYGHPEFVDVWDNAIQNIFTTNQRGRIMKDYIEIIK